MKDWKTLQITNDGRKTQVIVDGKDITERVVEVHFIHDNGESGGIIPRLRVTYEINPGVGA